MARTIVDDLDTLAPLTRDALVALIRRRENEALALAVGECEEERRAWHHGDGNYAADGCAWRIRALMVKR